MLLFRAKLAADPQVSEVHELPHARSQADRARSAFGPFWLLMEFLTSWLTALIVTTPRACACRFPSPPEFEKL